MTIKINLTGRFVPNEGYGTFTYKFLEHLTKQGVDAAPIHMEMFNSWQHEHFRQAGYDLNRPLLLIHPPDLKFVTYVPGRVWAFTMYESTKLPKYWVDNLNKHCERLIVPTEFCRQLFTQQGTKIPIHIVPGGIEPSLPVFTQVVDRPFTFLSLGDRGDRKGHDLAWRAFYEVFGNSDDVRFVIKARQDPEGVISFITEAGTDYRTSLFKGDVKETKDIFANVDAFVFPTRGEGYGLPPREASACGIPTICTKWSGTDDCDNWAFPIDKFKLKESNLSAGGRWAEPDFEQLKDLMWFVYAERERAKAQAVKHAQWLRENQTWEQAATTLHGLFKEHMKCQ